MMIEKLTQLLLNTGTSEKYSFSENRKIRLVNMSIFIFSLTSLFFIFFNFFVTRKETLAFIEILLFIILSSLFYFQNKGFVLFVRHAFIFLLQSFLIASIFILVPGKMVEYLLLSVILLQMLLYKNKVVFISLYLCNVILFYMPQVLFHTYPDEHYSYVNPSVLFISLAFIIYNLSFSS